ncbi:MAG: DEAD/DEAH box helicase [Deltaproteobacteria bacterium]|nr:DEAD/DEAH box helicase [Deltaproteobacteria bacterium]
MLQPCFHEMDLSAPVCSALDAVGYETPTPIQSLIIPHVLSGRDVLGQAQTGTGKTAAFALPLLSRIDLANNQPQVLVLTPTRELAIQVAEAFQRYASGMPRLQVLPIYGGQSYEIQLKQLRRGVHVVVGTPGRVMDHMRRKTLRLDELQCLVLDEADEMLKMGFVEDVEWVLDQTPPDRQVALFSATIPPAIRKIAQKHLNDPEEVTIRDRTTTAATIHQRYWLARGLHKLDAMTRILETETCDGVLVFVRTKTATAELAEKLEACGYTAAPLNGDISQSMRERTVNQFKSGKLNILVATDVAARGLDVERISHVINYDIPYDTESYVHRVGRTGRAGRSGEAILFVAPREQHLLRAIERATKQKIEKMEMPGTAAINAKRVADFKQRITDTLANEDTRFYADLIVEYIQQQDVHAVDICAALAKLLQGNTPLLMEEKPPKPELAFDRGQPRKKRTAARRERPESPPEDGMERYRIEVGHNHRVKPGNIVGAIANEAGIDSEHIGRITINDDHSTVDLPEGMPRTLLRSLKKVWISGQQLRISKLGEQAKPQFDRNKNRPKQFSNKSSRPERKRRLKLVS